MPREKSITGVCECRIYSIQAYIECIVTVARMNRKQYHGTVEFLATILSLVVRKPDLCLCENKRVSRSACSSAMSDQSLKLLCRLDKEHFPFNFETLAHLCSRPVLVWQSEDRFSRDIAHISDSYRSFQCWHLVCVC